MKILIISPNQNALLQVGSLLDASTHAVACVEASGTPIWAAAEREQPDLMLLEGAGCDASRLEEIEYATSRRPAMAVILLCPSPSPEFLLQAMRAGVREVVPYPANPGAVEAAIKRVAAKFAGTAERMRGQAVAFMPCKGGSGATFLATNLGYQLAEHNSVLLVDLNLQFGDALTFVHDTNPASTLADVAREIERVDSSLLTSSAVRVGPNYSILAAPQDPDQALEIKPEHVARILEVAVSSYDFVLVDLPRSIDPVTIKALDIANKIYPVLQQELPYLRNAQRLLAAFQALGYPAARIEPIVNRFDRRCEIGLEAVRRLTGDVRLHTVPNSYRQVSASINQGSPLAELASGSPIPRFLSEFSQTLSPRPEVPRRLFGRLLGRT